MVGHQNSVVLDSLLIVTPFVGFCNCSMLIVRYFMSILVLQSSPWGRDSWLLCYALFVFLVSHDCCVALPHDATGLSAVCNCGIS